MQCNDNENKFEIFIKTYSHHFYLECKYEHLTWGTQQCRTKSKEKRMIRQDLLHYEVKFAIYVLSVVTFIHFHKLSFFIAFAFACAVDSMCESPLGLHITYAKWT